MNIKLQDIEPVTPTELILKQYATKLEKEIKYRDFIDNKKEEEFLIHEEEVTVPSVKHAYLHGLAMVEVYPWHENFQLVVNGKPNGSPEYSAAVLVPDMKRATKTYVADRMFDLWKKGLQHISDIYTA